MTSLEWAEDAAAGDTVRRFWDAHLLFALAVQSDYDFLALRTSAPNAGAVVHGFAPAFEEASVVAASFAAFADEMRVQARAAEPSWPWSVFLMVREDAT